MTPTVVKVVTINIDDLILLNLTPWDELRALFQALRKRRVRIVIESDILIEDYRLMLDRRHIPYDLLVDRGRER